MLCNSYRIRIANRDIRHFIRSRRVPPLLRINRLKDVSLGVNYLHGLAKQIIHNDLKAANVLFSANIVAKITDFSLAQWDSVTSKLSYVKSQCLPLVATNTHRSPENWFNINESNAKSDIYSLGILAWEIFSDEIPFNRCVHDEDIKLAVTSGQRPDMTKLRPSTLKEIPDMIEECWHQDPVKRPTISEVMTKLINICKQPQSIEEIQRAIKELTAQNISVEENVDNQVLRKVSSFLLILFWTKLLI